MLETLTSNMFKTLTLICLKYTHSVFSSYVFVISMFRSLIYQIFILECYVRKGSIFSFWQNEQSLLQ